MVIKKGSFEEEIGMPTQPGKKITIDNDEIAKKILRQEQNLPAPGWDWKEMSLLKKVLVAAFIFAVFGIVVAFSLPAGTRDNVANAIFAKTTTDGMDGTGPSGGAGNPPIIGTATPTPVKNKTGNPSGTTAPTAEKEPIKVPLKAGEIALEYVIISENSKISEIKPYKIYIYPANLTLQRYQTMVFFIIDKEDIPTIPSITIGETTLSNFRIVQTTPERDIVSLEWDIASEKKFSTSMATLSKLPFSAENFVSGGPAIEIYGKTIGRYNFDKWSQSRYVYITVNSP